jgi:multiple antibiotic resistance protein
MTGFVNIWIRFLVLLAPFFALSMFLLYTADRTAAQRRGLALKVTAAVFVVSFCLFFLGESIFRVVGITIDSFRVGAGALLFLSAVGLVQGQGQVPAPGEDIAVVPLAVPIIVGPATTGAILVMGAESTTSTERLLALVALSGAILSIGAVLLLADTIERLIRHKGIVILSKLTGLFLSALAVQMVFGGIRHLLDPRG